MATRKNQGWTADFIEILCTLQTIASCVTTSWFFKG